MLTKIAVFAVVTLFISEVTKIIWAIAQNTFISHLLIRLKTTSGNQISSYFN